jgi:hypothetical protein
MTRVIFYNNVFDVSEMFFEVLFTQARNRMIDIFTRRVAIC